MQNYPFENLDLKNLKGERWKEIPGLEHYFQVSSFGRVKRLPYQLEYADGRIYFKKEKIIKPVLMEIYNRFMNDHLYFLRVAVTLEKRKYNFSLARLVYHCFIEPLPGEDEEIVILTKDGDGKNIHYTNLQKARISDKQRRMSDLNRRPPLVLDEAAKRKKIAATIAVQSKQISQYNLQGHKIRTYTSATVAGQQTGISRNAISRSARGSGDTAGGFIWRLGSALVVDIASLLQKKLERKERNKAQFGKIITQYTTGGKRIEVFPTLNDAARSTGVNRSGITRCLTGKGRTAGGFYWREGEGPLQINLRNYLFGGALRGVKNKKPVWQLSLRGRLLKKFPSVKEAAAEVGIAAATLVGALRGSQLTTAGYKWRYAESKRK